jgi:hypothetical protein
MTAFHLLAYSGESAIAYSRSPVAERSKARVYGRSLAGIACSNPAWGIDISVVCCTVRIKRKIQDNQDKQARLKYKDRTKKIQLGAWMSVCCKCCVLSGRRFGDGLITRPEESYRLWCVIVCNLETWRTLGCSARNKQNNTYSVLFSNLPCWCTWAESWLCTDV